ncbi:hypothetical protein Tco_0316574 [Tanacetum coccineum]
MLSSSNSNLSSSNSKIIKKSFNPNTNNDSEDGQSYAFVFISEVQNQSTSFMNPLYSQGDHEQTYHEQQEIIKPIIGNDQIISDIIFDDPHIEFNDGKVEHDKNVHDQQDNAMELLAGNAYKEVEKQQLLAKKNEDVVVKMSNSVQAMFIFRPKQTSFYDSQLKHGLVYENPYTLKKAMFENPKLYEASYLHSSNVRANICSTEEIIEDATKSQLKMKEKLKDPIAIENKVNFLPINYDN